jgi:hypothetical protein
VRQSADQHAGEPDRVEVGQRVTHPTAQRVTQSGVRQHAGGQLRPGLVERQRLGEQLGEVQHLDAPAAQRGRERVVLLLGASHPWDGVEQQRVVVSRGQAGELAAGSVEQDRAEAANFTVDEVRHECTLGQQLAPSGKRAVG